MNTQPTIPLRLGSVLDAPDDGSGHSLGISQGNGSGRRATATKFKPATIKRILKLIESGMPLSLAGPAAGISYRSLCFWRQTRPDFAELVSAAIAKGVEKRLAKIESASESGDWRAASWLLEHTQPEHFAKSRVQAEIIGNVKVEVDAKPVFDFATYERLCREHHGLPPTDAPILDTPKDGLNQKTGCE